MNYHMLLNGLVSLYVTCLNVGLSHEEVFTSVYELGHLLYIEKHLVHSLQAFITRTKEKLLTLERYIGKYEYSKCTDRSKSCDVTKSFEEFAGNPLHAYHLIKRFSIEWANIEHQAPYLEWKELESRIEKKGTYNFQQFNSNEDIQGIINGLLELQEMYRLPASSFARGTLLEEHLKLTMTADECFYIANKLLNSGKYKASFEWYDEAYRFAGLEGNISLSQNEVDRVRKELYSRPDSYILHLKCHFEADLPYLILSPLKVEVLHRHPRIILYHDAITDNEMKETKKISVGEMKRAVFYSPPCDCFVPSDGRIAKEAILNMENHMTLKSLGYKILYMTKSTLEGVLDPIEEFQVTNYGTGGRIKIHKDESGLRKEDFDEDHFVLEEDDLLHGERMTSLLFYLSDVESGGHTVFPKLGISAPLIKGSALMWYNIKRSGNPSHLAFHAGCPVLNGSKWIASKYISDRGQFLKRPCTLFRDEY